MEKVKEEALIALFTYHPATMEQATSYTSIRKAALNLTSVILEKCPSGPDRSAAIRKIREAVMTANASIATDNAASFLR